MSRTLGSTRAIIIVVALLFSMLGFMGLRPQASRALGSCLKATVWVNGMLVPIQLGRCPPGTCAGPDQAGPPWGVYARACSD